MVRNVDFHTKPWGMSGIVTVILHLHTKFVTETLQVTLLRRTLVSSP